MILRLLYFLFPEPAQYNLSQDAFLVCSNPHDTYVHDDRTVSSTMLFSVDEEVTESEKETWLKLDRIWDSGSEIVRHFEVKALTELE